MIAKILMNIQQALDTVFLYEMVWTLSCVAIDYGFCLPLHFLTEYDHRSKIHKTGPSYMFSNLRGTVL